MTKVSLGVLEVDAGLLWITTAYGIAIEAVLYRPCTTTQGELGWSCSSRAICHDVPWQFLCHCRKTTAPTSDPHQAPGMLPETPR